MFLGFIYKDKNVIRDNEKNYEIKQIELEAFSHVSMEAGCNLGIYNAEKPGFSYLVENETKHTIPVYEIKNDTLFIISTQASKHGNLKLMIKNLHSIKANNSKLYMSNIYLDTLSISLIKSNLRFGNKASILNLNLDLKDQSNVKNWNYTGREVKMNIENSSCQIRSNFKLKKVSGKIGENSNVTLPKTRRLDLDIDESSSVKMY